MTIDIKWHNLEPSTALIADIKKRYDKLRVHFPDVTSARITIDQPHHPGNRPHAFTVTLDISLPVSNAIVNHAGKDFMQTDLYQLVHQSFDAARRQLGAQTEIRHGKVKRHSVPGVPEIDAPESEDIIDD